MPKIIIKEYDNTSAGIGLYTNFSVLVPGFVKNTAAFAEVADEHDVLELSTKKDFLTYVGKVAPTKNIVTAAVAPVITGELMHFEGQEGIHYTQEEIEAAEEGDDAYGKTTEDWKVEPVLPKAQLIAFLGTLGTTSNLYSAEENDEDVGYLRDENYDYNLISKGTTLDDGLVVSAEDTFAVIEDSKVGSDATYATHYGNQIAFELINLGYTVLFKKLSASSDLEKAAFWNPLKDRSLYDFRYVLTGLLDEADEANKQIVALAEFNNAEEDLEDTGRGDCTALCDIDAILYQGKTQAEAISNIQGASLLNSKYAAYFAPFVTYDMGKGDGEYDYNTTFPASFHYLACAAKASENYNEWYAIAGYTRGVSRYTIKSVGCKFGEEAVQALEPRNAKNENSLRVAINLIIKLKTAYYLWGNRTAYKLGIKGEEDGDLVASHFLNIRQLCTSIKKQVYLSCRRLTYEPNSDLLWISFCNAIRPLLEKMKGDQGITDYKFIKIKNKQKAMLKAIIRIIPIEAVEDFDISLTLEDSISGIVADFED